MSLFNIALISTIGMYAIELCLIIRQWGYLSYRTVPRRLQDRLSQKAFDQAQEYQRAKCHVRFARDFTNFVHSITRLWWLQAVWLFVQWLASSVQGSHQTASNLVASLLFLVMLSCGRTLMNLPLGIWQTFVVDQIFGLNRKTLGTYFVSKVKTLLYRGLLYLPLTAVLLVVEPIVGPSLWLWAWAGTFIVSAVMWLVFPSYIAPWFVSFTPLMGFVTPTRDGAASDIANLQSQVAALATQTGYPLDRIFVTKESALSNSVYVRYRGVFGPKYLAISDTAIATLPTASVVALVGRELGRWSRSHDLIWYVLRLAYNGLLLYVYQRLIAVPSLYTAFGVSETFVIGYVIVGILCGPLNSLYGFLENAISHEAEYEVDAFSQNLGCDMSSALLDANVSNLEAPLLDPLYSVYFSNTPSLVERLRRLSHNKSE